MIEKKAVILPILVILSIQGIIGSIVFFNRESDKVSSYLTSSTGSVAGASTSEIIDLTKEIPIIPNAEIASVDTFQNSASITVESSLPEAEIKTYYEDYMLLNDWQQIAENSYKKGSRELKIEITGSLIKATLTRI